MKEIGRGLFTNSELLNQPDGLPCDGLNANYDKKDGSVSNEEGFDVHLTAVRYKDSATVATQTTIFPDGGIVIGQAHVDETRNIIFVYASTNNYHTIGILHNSGLYEIYFRENLLNFDYRFPITAEARIKNGEIIVSWQDNNEKDRILNLDDLPFPSGVYADRTLKVHSEIHLLNVVPNSLQGTMEITDLFDAGGSLISGAYQGFFWYETKDGTKLPYSEPTPPIIVNDASTSGGWEKYGGCRVETQTSKAIGFEFNLVNGYDFIGIGVLHTINGITSVYEIKRMEVLSTNFNYTYTGFEDRITIELRDYISAKAPYKRSKVVFQTNDNRLGFANLTGLDKVDYQKYANNIVVRSKKQKTYHHNKSLGTAGNKNSVFIANNRSLMPGDVVALYIGLELSDNRGVYVFHVPGREMEEIHSNDIYYTGFMEDMLVNESYIAAANPWLKSDDAISPGNVRYFQTRNTGWYSETGMGFWQNEDEFYPSEELDTNGDWEVWDSTGKIGDLWEKNIRHHKLPTMRGVVLPGSDQNKNTFSWWNASDKSSYIYGLELSNIYIPPELENDVVKIHVFMAKRTTQNQLVLGQGILFHNQTESSPRDDGFSTHGFDLMVEGNGNLATHITNEFMYKFWRDVDTVTGINKKFVMYDHYPSSYAGVVEHKYHLRMIYDTKYNEDILESDPNPPSDIGEKAAARFQGVLKYIDNLATPTLQQDPVPDNYPEVERRYLTTFWAWKQNVYQNFSEQELVLIGSTETLPIAPYYSIGSMYGGDCCPTDYAFRLINKESYIPTDQGLPEYSKRFLYFFPSICKNFAAFRNREDADDGDSDNHYYPYDTGSDWGWPFLREDIDAEVNKYNYDSSYSRVREPVHFTPFNYRRKLITKFPLRIILSEKSNEEESTDSWRTFLPNNYYDLPGNKGEIVNIATYGDEIIINTTRSLFKTIGSKQLKLQEVTTYIGSGEIFSMAPQEQVLPGNGYAGCSSKYSCQKTKQGYIYCNQDRGLIFQYDGKLKEISALGNKKWFEDNLPSKLKKIMLDKASEDGTPTVDFDFDNPIATVGLVTGLDIKYDRLVVTKIDYSIADGITYGGVVTDSFPGAVPQGLYYLASSDEAIAGRFVYWNGFTITKDNIRLTNTDYFVDESWTMTFSLGKNMWRTWHSYVPKFMFNNDNKSFYATVDIDTYMTQGIFSGNAKDKYGIYFDQATKNEFYVEFVINIEHDYTTGQPLPIEVNKLYDAFEWITEVYNSDRHNEYEKSFTSLLIYNENQSTDIITLSADNLKEISGSWRFNDFRDLVLDYATRAVKEDKGIPTSEKVISGATSAQKYWYEQYYLTGKYVVIRFIYNNIDQNEIYLHKFGCKLQRNYM